jgi:hypothetical protein
MLNTLCGEASIARNQHGNDVAYWTVTSNTSLLSSLTALNIVCIVNTALEEQQDNTPKGRSKPGSFRKNQAIQGRLRTSCSPRHDQGRGFADSQIWIMLTRSRLGTMCSWITKRKRPLRGVRGSARWKIYWYYTVDEWSYVLQIILVSTHLYSTCLKIAGLQTMLATTYRQIQIFRPLLLITPHPASSQIKTTHAQSMQQLRLSSQSARHQSQNRPIMSRSRTATAVRCKPRDTTSHNMRTPCPKLDKRGRNPRWWAHEHREGPR